MLRSIQSDALEIRQATQLAVLSTSSIDGFRMTIAQRMKWMDYSPARLRWVRAIHRVVVLNYVSKVRERIEEIETLQAARKRAARLNVRGKSSNHDANEKNKDDIPRPRILRKSVVVEGSDNQRSGGKSLKAFSSDSADIKGLSLPCITLRGSAGSLPPRPYSSSLYRRQEPSQQEFPSLTRVSFSSCSNTSSSASSRSSKMSFTSISTSSSSSDSFDMHHDVVPSIKQSFAEKIAKPPRPVTKRAYDIQEAIAKSIHCPPLP